MLHINKLRFILNKEKSNTFLILFEKKYIKKQNEKFHPHPIFAFQLFSYILQLCRIIKKRN
jgi:hypothetical protein